MSGNTRAPIGNTLMNFYCTLSQRYPATARLVSENFNGPVCKNIQRIYKKMDPAMGSPIIAISNIEAIIFFVNNHKNNFKKYDKVSATILIVAK